MFPEMERCDERRFVAERFKASAKGVNQVPADAIVSAQKRDAEPVGEQLVAEEERWNVDNERPRWRKTAKPRTQTLCE